MIKKWCKIAKPKSSSLYLKSDIEQTVLLFLFLSFVTLFRPLGIPLDCPRI